MDKEGWKTMAITLVVIDIIWAGLFITLYYIGIEVLHGEDKCMEYCEMIGATEYSYSWEMQKCECFKDGRELNALPEMPAETSGNARLSMQEVRQGAIR